MHLMQDNRKDNICGYVVHFMQKIAFWHNHLFPEVKMYSQRKKRF